MRKSIMKSPFESRFVRSFARSLCVFMMILSGFSLCAYVHVFISLSLHPPFWCRSFRLTLAHAFRSIVFMRFDVNTPFVVSVALGSSVVARLQPILLQLYVRSRSLRIVRAACERRFLSCREKQKKNLLSKLTKYKIKKSTKNKTKV